MTEDIVQRLRSNRPLPTLPHEAADLIEALSAENKRLCEALAFYARENSWKSCGMYMSGRPNPSPAEIDKGGKASAALDARGLEIREKNDE